jgi:hypothetical protein
VAKKKGNTFKSKKNMQLLIILKILAGASFLVLGYVTTMIYAAAAFSECGREYIKYFYIGVIAYVFGGVLLIWAI